MISNFALIDQMSLLKTLVNGNGAWCATVASECAAGARIPELAAMGGAGEIFGEPLYPDAAEHVNIVVLQERMRQPGDPVTAHLGEAETITIIVRRRLEAAFVTDDRDAERQARAEGIRVYNTWDILKLAVATGNMSLAEFEAAHATLVGANRGHPPCARTGESVRQWLAKR